MDLEEKLSELENRVEAFAEESPEKMKAFQKLSNVIKEDGVLSEKDKELIAIALAVNQKCEDCIAHHVNDAVEAGASKEEILEATWMAVLMGGGPSLVHAGLALECVKDLTE